MGPERAAAAVAPLLATRARALRASLLGTSPRRPRSLPGLGTASWSPRGLRPRSLRLAPCLRLYAGRPPRPLRPLRRLSARRPALGGTGCASSCRRCRGLCPSQPGAPRHRAFGLCPGAVVFLLRRPSPVRVRLRGATPRRAGLAGPAASCSPSSSLAGRLRLSRFSVGVSVSLRLLLAQVSLVSRCLGLSLVSHRVSVSASLSRVPPVGLCFSVPLASRPPSRDRSLLLPGGSLTRH